MLGDGCARILEFHGFRALMPLRRSKGFHAARLRSAGGGGGGGVQGRGVSCARFLFVMARKAVGAKKGAWMTLQLLRDSSGGSLGVP